MKNNERKQELLKIAYNMFLMKGYDNTNIDDIINEAKIAKEKGTRFGRPEIKRPENFDEEYKKWKNGEQTAKITMEKLGLKRGKFYMFVREREEK